MSSAKLNESPGSVPKSIVGINSGSTPDVVNRIANSSITDSLTAMTHKAPPSSTLLTLRPLEQESYFLLMTAKS